MDNWQIALLGAWIIGSPFVAIIFGKYLKRVREQTTTEVPEVPFDLGEPIIRFRLQTMFDNMGMTGDANIRDGRVFPAPSDDQKSAMSQLLLEGYALGLGQEKNDNRMLCAWIDGKFVPTNVSLIDLRHAAIMLEDR